MDLDSYLAEVERADDSSLLALGSWENFPVFLAADAQSVKDDLLATGIYAPSMKLKTMLAAPTGVLVACRDRLQGTPHFGPLFREGAEDARWDALREHLTRQMRDYSMTLFIHGHGQRPRPAATTMLELMRTYVLPRNIPGCIARPWGAAELHHDLSRIVYF